MPSVGISGPHGLTDRELAVLELIAEGRTNLESAECLGLSINTVKSYIRTAYRKIDVTRRGQAIRWGLHDGFGARPESTEARDREA